MNTTTFIENFRKAFGDTELPLAFWYSSEEHYQTEKTRGCYIKYLKTAREGTPMSFDGETIACMGGKFYTGFTEMSPFIPNFVSNKERYKETPEQVLDFIGSIGFSKTEEKYIHFVRIDQLDSFDHIEGLIFFATPDILTGLASWVFYDNNQPDAISVPFGSGCSSMISQVTAENKRGGKRCFIGLLDPSVRPCVEANILSFAIPLSRFRVMYETMIHSCLHDTHAWGKVKERINHE